MSNMDESTGRDLFEAIDEQYELSPSELVILEQAQRTVDLIVDLQAVLDADGPMVDGQNGSKVHPCVAELRQQRIVVARLLAAMRIPVDDEGEPTGEGRTQRRGLRGVYALGEAS